MRKKKDKRSIAKGLTYLGGSAVIGQQTIRSGIPRLLGVRLETHSTSKQNAKEILKNGGYLDPNRGGTGASKAVNDAEYIAKSKNYIHLTGKHKNHKIEISRDVYKDIDGNVTKIIPKYQDVKPNLTRDILQRKFQKSMYRGITGETVNVDNAKGIGKALSNILVGATGLKGKTLYLGGSDKYFNRNFVPDEDDLGLKSAKKVKIYGNRATATMEALKREGRGNRLKGAVRLIKANPKRALAGVAILGVGGTITAMNAKTAYDSFNPNIKVKGYSRKTKSGKWSNVKSFIREKLKRN